MVHSVSEACHSAVIEYSTEKVDVDGSVKDGRLEDGGCGGKGFVVPISAIFYSYLQPDNHSVRPYPKGLSLHFLPFRGASNSRICMREW